MSVEHFRNGTPLSKCDAVAQALQDKIIKGIYKTGDQLPPEAALCEMFGVSRITIRESLKKLSMMGLVSIRQGKGTFVRSVDLGLFMKPMFQMIDFDDLDIDAMYDARFYFESGTARLAAEACTEEDKEEITQILEKMGEAFDRAEIGALAALDVKFHIAIASASKNPILRAAVITLEDITSACRKRLDKYEMFLQDSYRQHQEIFEAIKAGDADAAEAAMQKHALASKKFLKFGAKKD